MFCLFDLLRRDVRFGRMVCTTLKTAAVSALCLAGRPLVAQTVISTPSMGSGPRAMVVNPVTNQVYVANFGSNNVTVIDGATNVVANTVNVGTSPEAVAVKLLATNCCNQSSQQIKEQGFRRCSHTYNDYRYGTLMIQREKNFWTKFICV
jgi:YVTN family beta-propeller protein